MKNLTLAFALAGIFFCCGGLKAQQNTPNVTNNDPSPNGNPNNPGMSTQDTKQPVYTDEQKAAPLSTIRDQEERARENNKPSSTPTPDNTPANTNEDNKPQE